MEKLQKAFTVKQLHEICKKLKIRPPKRKSEICAYILKHLEIDFEETVQLTTYNSEAEMGWFKIKKTRIAATTAALAAPIFEDPIGFVKSAVIPRLQTTCSAVAGHIGTACTFATGLYAFFRLYMIFIGREEWIAHRSYSWL